MNLRLVATIDFADRIPFPCQPFDLFRFPDWGVHVPAGRLTAVMDGTQSIGKARSVASRPCAFFRSVRKMLWSVEIKAFDKPSVVHLTKARPSIVLTFRGTVASIDFADIAAFANVLSQRRVHVLPANEAKVMGIAVSTSLFRLRASRMSARLFFHADIIA